MKGVNPIKSKYKIMLLFVILIAGFTIIRFYGIDNISPRKLKMFILSFGWKAPLIYILLYSIRPLFLFPASILTLAGGLSFGTILGTVYEIIGAVISAALAYCISNRLGREYIQTKFGTRFKKVSDELEKNGFKAILILRLIPITPFDAVGYIAGVSSIKFKDYILGTLIGIVPSALAYNFLGDSLLDPFSKKFYVGLVMMLVFTAVPIIFLYFQKKRKKTE